jgi:hypothetical protein
MVDEDGSRRVSMFLPVGTRAGTALSGGLLQELDEVIVSATEYTTGPNGLAAMPADLPPATAYTYAVELSVGEGQGGFFAARRSARSSANAG